MILLDIPPSYLRNDYPVKVESLLPGTTAHRKGCPAIRRETVTISLVQAFVHLHASWCSTCMRRSG